jgi:mercuric ion binding protein
MKFTKTILMSAFAGLLIVGCKQTGSEPKTETDGTTAAAVQKTPVDPAKLETASFTIEGMTCAIGCAKTIEKELAETEGVQKASVDFDKKMATVEFDMTKQTPETLTKIVEATADGKTYKVSDMKASKDHAMLLPQDQEKEKPADPAVAKSKKKSAKEGKGCCAGKKHCAMDEKKA